MKNYNISVDVTGFISGKKLKFNCKVSTAGKTKYYFYFKNNKETINFISKLLKSLEVN